jgi:hypothetical protein
MKERHITDHQVVCLHPPLGEVLVVQPSRAGQALPPLQTPNVRKDAAFISMLFHISCTKPTFFSSRLSLLLSSGPLRSRPQSR